MEQPNIELMVQPDWQPVETLPKDGSVVRLALQWIDLRTGEILYGNIDVFWGRMSGYPDEGDVWVDTRNPINGLYEEEKFIREVFHYSQETSYLYRGSRIIGWTRPWAVKVRYPMVDNPALADLERHST